MTSAVSSANFFAVLSEENSKPEFHEPSVKTNTKSSKKEDKNPKADASKARPKKRDPNANNAAFKDKSAGREANQKVPVGPEASHHRRGKTGARDDRRNKSGKQDTEKREKSGWGDNKKELEEEQAGESIAKADEAAEAAEEEEPVVDNTQTLEQYLASKEAASINVARSGRKPNEGSDNQQWANAAVVKRPEIEKAAPRNQGRTRARKEVQTLEPSNEHLPSLVPQRSERSERPSSGPRSRGAPRSGDKKPAAKGPSKGAKGAKGAKVPSFDVASLPRLG